MSIMLHPIGVIHTPYHDKDDTPAQGSFRPHVTGTVEVFPEYAVALENIEEFTHLILLYELDRAAAVELRRVPLLIDEPKGLFATRFPARPSRIGLTVVTLLGCSENRLTVGMVDMLDGTPLIDIKPYVPQFDAFPEASSGWFAGCSDRPKPPGRE